MTYPSTNLSRRANSCNHNAAGAGALQVRRLLLVRVVVVVVVCLLSTSNLVVDALPSFGTKIPNGERVPCPSSAVLSGCTASGFCFGLGHPNCGGFRQEDKIVIEENNNNNNNGSTSSISLSPFGEDWKKNGFVWTKELCELDSDQDGYTNGDELGDPCCVWSVSGTTATTTTPMLDSMEGFIPSHPGMKDDTPPVGFEFDKASLCGFVDEIEDENIQGDPEEDASASASAADPYFNPGETRGEFEMRIKPYPIPVQTTTYVDFVFNLPDDLPDLVHVVFGEAIVSQPDHLHHFVLYGCSSRVEDPSQEGVPSDRSERDCQQVLGGWAPGSDVFGNSVLDTGVALGKHMGIQALKLNVHYSDGAYVDADADADDEQQQQQKMATDGIRVYFTPDLRPFTSVQKQVISVPYGPPEMVIPPNESRYFISKTCNVNTSCKDASDATLQQVARFLDIGGGGGGGDGRDDEENAAAAASMASITCATIKAFCFLGDFGSYVQQLCPFTCGLCGDDDEVGEDGNAKKKNVRNPGSYRVSSVNYHAHLLGSEMYTTLLRDDAGDEQQQQQQQDVSSPNKKQATGTKTTTTVTAKDMKSREIWYYDDQATIPMDYEYEYNNIEIENDENDENKNNNTLMMRGVEIKPGDKIQATCVYDSTDRTENTKFGLSTYDEMCIISLYVTFETPLAMLKDDDTSTNVAAVAANADFVAELMLRTFSCDVDHELHTTDVYQGILTTEEDPRNIWLEHPIDDTDMCTFPVADYVLVDSFLTQETRNCPSPQEGGVDVNDKGICHGLSSDEDGVVDVDVNVEFLFDVVAGFTCEGGTFDQMDSNEAPSYVTKEDCIDIGGGVEYAAYTCFDAEVWLLNEATIIDGVTSEVAEFLRTDWWQPKCCSRHQSSSSSPNSTEDVESSSSISSKDKDNDNNGDGDGDEPVTDSIQADYAEESSTSATATFGNALAFLTTAWTIMAIM